MVKPSARDDHYHTFTFEVMLQFQQSPLLRRISQRSSNRPYYITTLSRIYLIVLFISPIVSALYTVHGDRSNFLPGKPDTEAGVVHRQQPPNPEQLDQRRDGDSALVEVYHERRNQLLDEAMELGPERSVERASFTNESSTTTATSFPSPFDTSLGDNFTAQSCPQFFSTFLSNSTFRSCRAISLLLENSNSFFRASSSAASLDQILELSCSVNVTACTVFMAHLASDLIKNSACGQDYNLGNPIVTQAYTGMTAYQATCQATCLKEQASQDFCFSRSATNSTNAADYYVYFLALGMALPASSRPTCNQCLQNTMQVFENEAQYVGQPLTQTYIPAAEQINLGCGPNFANTSVLVGSKAAISTGSLVGQRPNMAIFIYTSLLSIGALALGIL